MTGRERIRSAMSGGGGEIGVAIPYQGIYIRDHVHDVTDSPWWCWRDGDVETHKRLWREYIGMHDVDWHHLSDGPDRHEQANVRVVERGGKVFRADGSNGTEQEIFPPAVSGDANPPSENRASDRAGFDLMLGDDPSPEDYMPASGPGSADIALWMREEFPDKYMIRHVTTPLWGVSTYFGFDAAMMMPYDDPELLRHATRRLVKRTIDSLPAVAQRGADGVWLEECYTDMYSPKTFAEFNAPLVKEIVDAVHASGMQAVYYYCGDPADRWEHLLSAGADGIHLEESKKRFRIDIAEASAAVGDRACLFGNLDAVGVLEAGSDAELRDELARQIEVGRSRGGRFVVSLGSPVTPGTPVERVLRYREIARELCFAS